MKKIFGLRRDGKQANLYTIRAGKITAEITDHGATLVKLLVPDSKGNLADVVLGFDNPDAYTDSGSFFGAVVGRNANRIGGAKFTLQGREYTLDANDNGVNNLHSGFDPYKNRLWQVVRHEESSICLRLESPDGDQGFPGNAVIEVTYRLDNQGGLHIVYDGVCDKDTVFNMTNHTYFNLAGHDKPEMAMAQVLSMPSRAFCPDDALNIPLGEMRSVAGTPMDFRKPKAVGADIGEDYDALQLQGGYDHNYEVFCNPCAILSDPTSGRAMAVSTDCPGVQLYSGNFLEGETGKNGTVYTRRGGVCLETQFYPNSVNYPQWQQPFTPAGQHYHSETVYKFL
jgi:aldose 1-epimerase